MEGSEGYPIIHSITESPNRMIQNTPTGETVLMRSLFTNIIRAKNTASQDIDSARTNVLQTIPVGLLTNKKARKLFTDTVGALCIGPTLGPIQERNLPEKYEALAQRFQLDKRLKPLHDRLTTLFQQPLSERYSNFMAMVNGENARVLGNKFTMLETLRELDLGFTIPRQTMIDPAQPIEAALEATNHLQSRTGYILKPRDGTMGRNIFVVKPIEHEEENAFQGRLQTAVQSCVGTKSHYIVQEFVPFDKKGTDIRLVMFGDNEGQVFVTYLKQVRPTVTGNGTSTLKDLIKKSTLSETQKQTVIASLRERYRSYAISKQLRKRGVDVDQIIPEGEIVPLSEIGNAAQGSLSVAPTEVETQNLNQCVAHLVKGLRDRRILPQGAFSLCLDTGVDLEVFNKPNVQPEELYKAMTMIEPNLPYAPPSLLMQDVPTFLKWLNGMFYAVGTRNDKMPELIDSRVSESDVSTIAIK